MKPTNNGTSIDETKTFQFIPGPEQINSKRDIPENLMINKSFNEWLIEIEDLPEPKKLFGELWYENELSFLFADTGTGKSTLAVQIGDSITSGTGTLNLPMEAQQGVLYYDFEMKKHHLKKRYYMGNNRHQFHDSFRRLTIDPNSNDDVAKYILDHINEEMNKSGYRCAIIDNLTALGSDFEKSRNAETLMKGLNKICLSGASILTIAHTTKVDQTRPIILDDMQGSKAITKLADSAFTISQSHCDTNLRYIKHLKGRCDEKSMWEQNVLICETEKIETFLGITPKYFDSEWNHLKKNTPPSQNHKEDQTSKILDLQKKGWSNREIAKTLNMSEGTVRNRLKETKAPI